MRAPWLRPLPEHYMQHMDPSARDAERHIQTGADDAPRRDAMPRDIPLPFGWLIDDSQTLRPWFLAYSPDHQSFVDEKRGRGKLVTTLWADGDSATRLEAYRLKAARCEEIARKALETKGTQSVPESWKVVHVSVGTQELGGFGSADLESG